MAKTHAPYEPEYRRQMVVLRANMPFFHALVAFMLAAIAVPEIATWLPALIRE